MMSEEEVEKRIAEEVTKARQQQAVADFGKIWFTEALAHTAGMVNRGEFPVEAHQVGQMCFQQFMGVPTDGGKKQEEKPKES